MYKCYSVPGINYHEHKVDFKKIIKKYSMKWSGHQSAGRWTGTGIEVRVTFIRDPFKDITIESKFEIDGDGEAFKELCVFMEEVFKGRGQLQEDVDWNMRVFDYVNEPNVEYLKSLGMPDSMIKMEVEKYKKKRAEIESGSSSNESKKPPEV